MLEEMALIVEVSDDAVIALGMDDRIVGWNPGAEAMFGYTAVEMFGRTTEPLTPENLRDEAAAIKARARRGEAIRRFETVRVAKSGQILEVLLSLFPIRAEEGAITGITGILRDITDLKKAERRLRRLSRRLLQIQDYERRRIARELHDSTCQTLAALAMNLSVLRQAGSDESKRRPLLDDSVALAEQCVRELRTQSYLLHPPLLDERGLPSAVRWFVEGFTARSKIPVQLEIDPRLDRLPEAVETAVFRVLQESLTNVHRHSRSPDASIALRLDRGWIELEVRDHGCGLPPETQEELGVGIAGMRERLLELGGKLSLTSADSGTCVTAQIPLDL